VHRPADIGLDGDGKLRFFGMAGGIPAGQGVMSSMRVWMCERCRAASILFSNAAFPAEVFMPRHHNKRSAQMGARVLDAAYDFGEMSLPANTWPLPRPEALSSGSLASSRVPFPGSE
jgi:hypothetical protein